MAFWARFDNKMEESPERNGYVPSEAIATHQQDTNANVLPARNTVSSLYLTTQQPGDHGNPAATQPNGRVSDCADLPPNHIWLAALSAVFCPCGFVSLCYSVQVNSNFANGNTVGAQYNSRQAWKWGMISVAIGCVVVIVVLCFYLVRVSLHVSLQ